MIAVIVCVVVVFVIGLMWAYSRGFDGGKLVGTQEEVARQKAELEVD